MVPSGLIAGPQIAQVSCNLKYLGWKLLLKLQQISYKKLATLIPAIFKKRDFKLLKQLPPMEMDIALGKR